MSQSTQSGLFLRKESYKQTHYYLVVINVFHLCVKAPLKGVRVFSRRPTVFLGRRETSSAGISGQTLKWRQLWINCCTHHTSQNQEGKTIPVADWNNSGNTERTYFILLKQKLASDYMPRKKPPYNRVPFFVLTPLIRYHRWGRIYTKASYSTVTGG